MNTTISISNLQISCIIGVLDHERITKQLVSVDIEILFDGGKAAKSESIELTHDYSSIAKQVEFILTSGEFMLIESAAELVLNLLLLPPTDSRPKISLAKVTITKADALEGTALASVTMQGSEEDAVYKREEKLWGYVDIIGETERLGLYRLTLSPLAILPRHYHEKMLESELVMSPGMFGLSGEGKEFPLSHGDSRKWKKGEVHGYTNKSSKDASILCMDRPSFIPSDEIEISSLEGSQ